MTMRGGRAAAMGCRGSLGLPRTGYVTLTQTHYRQTLDHDPSHTRPTPDAFLLFYLFTPTYSDLDLGPPVPARTLGDEQSPLLAVTSD